MKIEIFNKDRKSIGGTLTDAEFKIINEVFEKAKPEDVLEIELLDKKGFISEKKVRDIIDKALRISESIAKRAGHKSLEYAAHRGTNQVLTELKKELGLE